MRPSRGIVALLAPVLASLIAAGSLLSAAQPAAAQTTEPPELCGVPFDTPLEDHPTVDTSLPPPSGLRLLSAKPMNLTMAWDAVDGADCYEVYWFSSDEPYWYVGVGYTFPEESSGVLSHRYKGLIPETHYEMRVRTRAGDTASRWVYLTAHTTARSSMRVSYAITALERCTEGEPVPIEYIVRQGTAPLSVQAGGDPVTAPSGIVQGVCPPAAEVAYIEVTAADSAGQAASEFVEIASDPAPPEPAGPTGDGNDGDGEDDGDGDSPDPQPQPTTKQIRACFTNIGNLSGAQHFEGSWDGSSCPSHHLADSAARYVKFTITEPTTVEIDLDSGILFVSIGTPLNGWATPPKKSYDHRIITRRDNGKLIFASRATAVLDLSPGQYTAEAVSTRAASFTLSIEPQ